MNRDDRHPHMALPAWSLEQAVFEEIRSGHINRTWSLAHAGTRYILQWLNPIFDAKLHLDIEAITARLAAKGLTTPRLVPTRSGELWAVGSDGGVWRLFTFVEGLTLLTADSAERCREAGRLLGHFHRALWGFEHEFHFGRFGVHDTPKHLAALERALEACAGHSNFEQVAAVASEILTPGPPGDAAGLTPRLVHGDPKISN
jgi:Ser/Thr protein kinase RdoA (MazF antagonist)